MQMSKALVRLMILMLCLATTGKTVTAGEKEDNAAINRVLDQLEQCYLEEDLYLLGSLLSDSGYALVMRKPADPSQALVFGKSRMLELTAKRWQQIDFFEHKHIQRRIEVNGPIAKTRSVIRDRTSQGGPSNVQVFHILAHEDGQWKLVFSSALVFQDF